MAKRRIAAEEADRLQDDPDGGRGSREQSSGPRQRRGVSSSQERPSQAETTGVLPSGLDELEARYQKMREQIEFLASQTGVNPLILQEAAGFDFAGKSNMAARQYETYRNAQNTLHNYNTARREWDTFANMRQRIQIALTPLEAMVTAEAKRLAEGLATAKQFDIPPSKPTSGEQQAIADLLVDARYLREKGHQFRYEWIGIDIRFQNLKDISATWDTRGIQATAAMKKEFEKIQEMYVKARQLDAAQRSAYDKKYESETKPNQDAYGDAYSAFDAAYGALSKEVSWAEDMLAFIVSDGVKAERDRKRRDDLALSENERARALSTNLVLNGPVVEGPLYAALIDAQKEVGVAIMVPPLNIGKDAPYAVKMKAYDRSYLPIREAAERIGQKTASALKIVETLDDRAWKARDILKPVTPTQAIHRRLLLDESASKRQASKALLKGLEESRMETIATLRSDLEKGMLALLSKDVEKFAFQQGVREQEVFDRVDALFARIEAARGKLAEDNGRRSFAEAFVAMTADPVTRRSDELMTSLLCEGLKAGVTFTDTPRQGMTLSMVGTDLKVTFDKNAYVRIDGTKEVILEKDLEIRIPKIDLQKLSISVGISTLLRSARVFYHGFETSFSFSYMNEGGDILNLKFRMQK